MVQETSKITDSKSIGKTREERAKDIMNKYLIGSAAAGLIAGPGLDIAAIFGVEFKMLHSFSKIYEVPFSEQAVKSAIGSLLGGLGANIIGRGVIGSLLKGIPLIGSLVGMVMMPAMAASFTYAIGKVFIQHLESGGTFLDFDPAKVRKHFSQMYKEGEKTATEIVATNEA